MPLPLLAIGAAALAVPAVVGTASTVATTGAGIYGTVKSHQALDKVTSNSGSAFTPSSNGM